MPLTGITGDQSTGALCQSAEGNDSKEKRNEPCNPFKQESAAPAQSQVSSSVRYLVAFKKIKESNIPLNSDKTFMITRKKCK